MRKEVRWILGLLLMGCAASGRAGETVFEYPAGILDIYDADNSCWVGMDETGRYPLAVVPELWLVGPPPTERTAVTMPVDHWVDLVFSGRLVGGEGSDIVVREAGVAGEEALLFVTDGADQECLLTRITVDSIRKGEDDVSVLGADLDSALVPFVPRAVRVVPLDRGGMSPGFDVASVQARVSHDCGTKACCPNPVSGAVGLPPDAKLTWASGYRAEEHIIYLDSVAAQVRARASAARYPAQPRDVNTFEPPGLLLGVRYYWCVDEVSAADANEVQAGDLWSFTVSDHAVVDDFEAYVQGLAIYAVWQVRGWTGIGLQAETLDTCQNSMVFMYYYDEFSRSELFRSFDTARDWTQGGANVLQLLLHGDLPDPATGEVYIALTDGVNERTLPCPAAVPVAGKPNWLACRILLEDFNNVDLTQVRGMAIGVRSVPSIPADASFRGTIYVAEIGLYRQVCLDESRPRADLTADCAVDYRDLERMARDWLDDRTRVLPVAAPNEPVLWYEFDGNANDRAGGPAGQVEGRVNWVPGVYGQAVHFMNEGDGVMVPNASEVFARIREAVTVTFWQYGDDTPHLNDTICCSNYAYGVSNPALAIHLGCWRNPGQYRWDCGSPWSLTNRVAGRHETKSEWAGRWNHWAFTKDIRVGPAGEKGRMDIYLNGRLYASRTGTDTPIKDITSLEIGTGWYGRYDGVIDDFEIFDYALTPAEIAYIATDGTGRLPQRPASPADLDDSNRVDLHDFSILATEWLHDGLWP
jgi:hypothetical protein